MFGAASKDLADDVSERLNDCGVLGLGTVTTRLYGILAHYVTPFPEMQSPCAGAQDTPCVAVWLAILLSSTAITGDPEFRSLSIA